MKWAAICVLLAGLGAAQAGLIDGKGKLGLIMLAEGKGKGKGLGGGKLGEAPGLLALSKGALISKKAASFPPAPADWAPGVCTGYPFCVPGYIEPTVAAAAQSCPDGFSPDETGMCVRATPKCLLGMQMVGDQCCIEKVSTTCYASMEAACPADAQTVGTVCTPSKVYSQVVDCMQVQPVPQPGPKEGAIGKGFLKLLLPKFDLGKGMVVSGKGAGVESKVVEVPTELFGKGKGVQEYKVEVAPKCFSKCCKQEREMACSAPVVAKAFAAPRATCPDNCPSLAGGSCVCSPGGPAPCPPGTKECGSVGGRICVSDQLCFGVDQCKVANILMPHFEAVSCPSSSSAGAGAGSAASAAASAGSQAQATPAGGVAAAAATAAAGPGGPEDDGQ